LFVTSIGSDSQYFTYRLLLLKELRKNNGVWIGGKRSHLKHYAGFPRAPRPKLSRIEQQEVGSKLPAISNELD